MNRTIHIEGYFEGDIRQYFQLGARTTLATRIFVFHPLNESEDRIILLNETEKRADYRRGTRLVSFDVELRFPLLNWAGFSLACGPANQGFLFQIDGSLYYHVSSLYGDNESMDDKWLTRKGYTISIRLGGPFCFRWDRYQQTYHREKETFYRLSSGFYFDW
ncbi:MAG: hypothetical protein KAS12_04825 [Candidatus Aenigmarchaeota archaeon]|nr:hypothetical protein [Candidatus Aenigmarchaeota archaeon]